MGDIKCVVGFEWRSRDSVGGVKPGCGEFAPVGPTKPDPSDFLLEDHGEII